MDVTKRPSVPMSIRIRCVDGTDYPPGKQQCLVKGSARGNSITLYTQGGDDWAHMTPSKARKLAKWLLEAACECDARAGIVAEQVEKPF